MQNSSVPGVPRTTAGSSSLWVRHALPTSFSLRNSLCIFCTAVVALQPTSTVRLAGQAGMLINFRCGKSMAEAHGLKTSY
jgi:hypothetical protein